MDSIFENYFENSDQKLAIFGAIFGSRYEKKCLEVEFVLYFECPIWNWNLKLTLGSSVGLHICFSKAWTKGSKYKIKHKNIFTIKAMIFTRKVVINTKCNL